MYTLIKSEVKWDILFYSQDDTSHLLSWWQCWPKINKALKYLFISWTFSKRRKKKKIKWFLKETYLAQEWVSEWLSESKRKSNHKWWILPQNYISHQIQNKHLLNTEWSEWVSHFDKIKTITWLDEWACRVKMWFGLRCGIPTFDLSFVNL